MLRVYLMIVLVLGPFFLHAQIQGQVTDTDGNPLADVGILVEHTTKGTLTNAQGFYNIELPDSEQITLIYQRLGHTSERKTIDYDGFPLSINIVMEEKIVQLKEVAVSNTDNPAHRIIRETIAKRRTHLHRSTNYKAQYYSRGLLRLTHTPKGLRAGLEGMDMSNRLDSLGRGILYLSETQSEILQDGDYLQERITASKVSGDSQGFSFNRARNLNLSFYSNSYDFGALAISPISDNAFSYYKYELIESYYDEQNRWINKVSVIPKHKTGPTYWGVIYIEEDRWQLCGVDLETTGNRMNMWGIETLRIRQQFTYLPEKDLWIKASQVFNFEFGMFGVKAGGHFSAVYSDYDFDWSAPKKRSPVITKIEEDANKKDSLFWQNRPIPLTQEESKDYTVSDSIEVLRSDPAYIDSLDRIQNKIKWTHPFMGFTHQKRNQKRSVSFNGFIRDVQFNTVQGWNATWNINYNKAYESTKQELLLNSRFQYGLSNQKLYPSAEGSYVLSRHHSSVLSFQAGQKLRQYRDMLSPTLNSVYTQLLGDNYAKYYLEEAYGLGGQHELVNGVLLFTNLAYLQRTPVFNHLDFDLHQSTDNIYQSNNPLGRDVIGTAPFEKHQLFLIDVYMRIRFKQYYVDHPDYRWKTNPPGLPELRIFYTAGLSNGPYNSFSKVRLLIDQSLRTGQLGQLKWLLNVGKFLNSKEVPYMDYFIPVGNESHVWLSGNTRFQFLPYYDRSSEKEFMAFHLKQDFNKWLLGQIPLIRGLDANTEIGLAVHAVPEHRAYTEWYVGLRNLGIGKFKIFHVLYGQGYWGEQKFEGFRFGIQF